MELIEVAGMTGPQGCMDVEGFYRAVFDRFGVDRKYARIQEVIWEMGRRLISEVVVMDTTEITRQLLAGSP